MIKLTSIIIVASLFAGCDEEKIDLKSGDANGPLSTMVSLKVGMGNGLALYEIGDAVAHVEYSCKDDSGTEVGKVVAESNHASEPQVFVLPRGTVSCRIDGFIQFGSYGWQTLGDLIVCNENDGKFQPNSLIKGVEKAPCANLGFEGPQTVLEFTIDANIHLEGQDIENRTNPETWVSGSVAVADAPVFEVSSQDLGEGWYSLAIDCRDNCGPIFYSTNGQNDVAPYDPATGTYVYLAPNQSMPYRAIVCNGQAGAARTCVEKTGQLKNTQDTDDYYPGWKKSQSPTPQPTSSEAIINGGDQNPSPQPT